jgi:hypothetical protein
MSFPNDRTYTFDANNEFSDNAAAYTASGYLQKGGADGVVDLGGNQGTSPAQQARIDAVAIFDVTAITVSGTQTYQLDIVVSNDPAFLGRQRGAPAASSSARARRCAVPSRRPTA